MKRRLLALLLSVMMILSLAPTAVFAEESDDAVKEGDPVVITTEEPAEEPSEDPEKEQPNRDSLSEEALAAQTAGNSGESAEGGTQPINVAKVGTTEYADIAEAIAVWGPGKTLTLLADVTYNQTVDVEVNATKSTQNWILDLGDYTWTANGCNAFRLYAAGGTVMNQNYGLKVYANENGGITATNKYCIECKYDISTKGYRPRLEIHGGTYSGSYIIYYKSLTCNDDNVSNGPSVFFEASTNGSEPIFNGGFALAKCPITINAGYFNGTTFNTYPVSSTADTNLNGGHFKTLSAFPDPKNNKGIMYNNRRLLFYNDGSFDVLSSVSENEYEAALTPVTVILTGNRGYNGSKSSLYESPILFKKADYAIQSYIKNGIEIVLNANVEAKQDITISSGTFTIDATAEGAAYTGTVTLSGTSGTFILKGAAATSVTVTNSDYLLRKSVDGTTYTLVKKSDCEAQIGYVGYATLADAIAAAEPTDEITVLKKAYYLNREVAANSTVTVSAPVTESGTSAMQINITAEGETEPEVVYVVSDNASAIVTTTVDNSVITNIDVPTVLASVARSDSKSVVISLSKEAATEAEKEAAGLKETDLAFEIHPVAIVTNANDATEVVAIDSKAGATWQFALDLGVANAGKTVCLWHHSGNEKTSLGVFVVNEEGKVNDVTMNSFSVVSVEFAVASAVVNNTLTYYDNLAEAIANADDGTTVTLLANVTGGGLFVGPNKFTTTGLTIDFNGKTYTVETPVGSTGTVNQALHFERGNEITLKGGTINVTNDSSKLAAFEMFMQNYGALTVENMNLDGTGIAVATYSDPKYEAYPEWYKTEKPQFNYNTAGNSVIRNSTITMPGALGVDDAAALRIEDDAVINVSAIATKGTDQRYASATSVVNVENGAQFKLSGDGGAATAFEAYLAAKGQSLGTPTNGVYTVEAQKVAQIGNTKYETLQAAIAAAADGDTITLLADSEETEEVVFEKGVSVTLDLNGHSVTANDDIWVKNGSLTVVGSSGSQINSTGYGLYVSTNSVANNTATLTINSSNVTVNAGKCGIAVMSGGVVNLQAGTINAGECGISNNGKNSGNTTISISGGEIISNDLGVYHPGPGTLTISGTASITGATAVYVKSGTVNITGGTLTGNGDAANYSYNGNGGNATGDALVVDNCGYPGGEPTVEISGGTFTSTYGKGIGSYAGNGATTLATVTATTNTITIPADEKWVENGNGGYDLVKKVYVAEIDGQGYESLAAAIAAVPTDGTETTITMIGDETINVATNPLTIVANKNVVLDLNGHEVVGQCNSGTSSALITNRGTLTIKDSSNPSIGKLIGGADPTWTWDGTDNYAGSYASNLIRNEGTLSVNGGYLYNASTGSAAYAIDNYGAGKVTINGGTLDAAYASAIRMFYNNGGAVTINAGTIGGEHSYMGVQVMGGTDADLTINGGTINAKNNSYSVYSNGQNDSSVTISGGNFTGDVGFSGSLKNENISITGGTFGAGVDTFGEQTGFITGGTFDVQPAPEYIDWTKTVSKKDGIYYVTNAADVPTGADQITQSDYSGEYYANKVYYYWLNDNVPEGGIYDFYQPFENPWLMDGEFIELKGNVTLDRDLTFTTEESRIAVTGGTFTLTFGNYNINLNSYDFVLPADVSCVTDKQTNIFSAPAGYELVETANQDGTYTYRVKAINYVAQIGNTKYETFEAAWNAAAKYDTITLLTDVEVSGNLNRTQYYDITINGDGHKITLSDDVTQGDGYWLFFKDVTLDLNGHTYHNTGRRNFCVDSGTTIILDSSNPSAGKIVGERLYVGGTGELKIQRGTVEAEINSYGGKVEVSGGDVNILATQDHTPGTVVNVTGGQLYKLYMNAGEATISGGTIINTCYTGNATTTIKGTAMLQCTANIGEGGTMNVTGGTIAGGGNYAIYSAGPNTINISGGTLTSNTYAIVFCGPGEDSGSTATLNITGGSITGCPAIGGSGNDFNPPYGKSDYGGTVINISGGTITGTSATGAAIYHPQAGVLNISETAIITGVTGIEMRDGTLNVSGGTITATGKPTSSTSNDSGTTTLGAGIAVAQHTTKKPITVNVTGGAINGYTPFVEVNTESNSIDDLAKITLSISGGTFTTTNGGTQAVYVGDFGKVNNKSNTGFITGGIYSTEPNEAYLATGYIPVGNGDGSYTVEAQKVAQIGDVKYETFEAAWNAAVDGNTITLLANCAGNGLVAAQNRFNTSGLTVDFDGHTYTVDGALVGSTGTETQAFQLLKDNKITFQNGAIYSENAKMLIQNYSNLTLDKMTLTLNNPNYASAYTLSNNNGDVVIDDTTINANTAGGFAFDVCRYASYPSVNVTVTGDSVINGNVEISASGSDPKDGFSLTLESGTMTGNIVVDATAAAAMEATPAKAKVTKDDDFDQAAPVGYLWSAADANGVQTLSKGAATLTHGQTITTYATLEEAFAHAADGDTINLVANCNGNGIIVAQDAFATNGLTVNFNGFTYTVDGSILAGSTGTKTQAFQLLKGNKITFNGGTIVADNANVKMLIQNYSNLTLNGMTLNATRGTNAVEYVLSTNNDSTTINNTNITAKENGVAFDVCTGWGGYTSNTVAVTGSSAISGDIEVSFYGEGTAPSLALNGGTHTGAIVMEQGADQATITKANAFTQDAPAGYVWVSNGDGTSTLVPKVYVAEIAGGAKYESLADALAAAVNDDKITIIADFAIDASKIAETDRIVVNKAVTIDFGEYTMSVPGELEPTANWAALFIDADVTITGTTGGIDCRDKENDSECGVYAFNVRNNATLTITGGHYHGGGTIVQAQLGHVVIEGGEFTVTPFDVPYGSNYALNCVDAAYQNGTAGFAIKGGTFVGFDPQDIAAEGEHTDFTDNGYVAIEQSTAGTFVVQPGYNVTFDADGGAPEPAAQRVAAGGKATEPATAPTKAGFTFDGWLLNDNAFDFNTVLTADIKLVALWTPEQTVGKCKASVSLTLSENINMNLYVYDLAEGTEAADYTIEATFNGNPKKTFQLGTDTLTVVQEGVTKYKMTVAEVYSYQMGIPVTITVKYQGSVVGTFDYTVKQFFSSKIINASSSEALKNLSKAGLDYGAAAQLYFDGKTYNAGVYQTHPENLVNAEFNQNNTVNATQPTNYSLSSAGNCPEGLSKVSVALVLGSETSIKVYFKYSGDINNLDIKAIRKDNENVRTVTEPVQESGGRYSVKITGIRSYELCQYFTITFSDNANSISLNYSPYYYAQKNWENEDMLLANLCHALVAYGDYAKAMWPND